LGEMQSVVLAMLTAARVFVKGNPHAEPWMGDDDDDDQTPSWNDPGTRLGTLQCYSMM
jgi:hypothetical protein